jgi:hypothetical protein
MATLRKGYTPEELRILVDKKDPILAKQLLHSLHHSVTETMPSADEYEELGPTKYDKLERDKSCHGERHGILQAAIQAYFYGTCQKMVYTSIHPGVTFDKGHTHEMLLEELLKETGALDNVILCLRRIFPMLDITHKHSSIKSVRKDDKSDTGTTGYQKHWQISSK